MKRQQWQRDNTKKKEHLPAVHSSKNLSTAKITSKWMVCQLDDCIDILKVVFEDKYNFMFLFNHSCGQDKRRSDGLVVENMKKYFGGYNQRCGKQK